MLRDLFFQASDSLTSLKSQTWDPQLEVPPGGPQPGFNPRTLDLEASTLPREHRGRLHVQVNKYNTYELEIYLLTPLDDIHKLLAIVLPLEAEEAGTAGAPEHLTGGRRLGEAAHLINICKMRPALLLKATTKLNSERNSGENKM